jgi:5-methylcytosine-specific restriction endonuclease McrA
MPRVGEPKVECACLHCGAVFLERPYRIRDGRGKYCSTACHDAARRVREQRACPTCGKSFEVTPAVLRKPRGSGTYCSRECADKGHRGKRTVRWNGGVLERREFEYDVWRKAVYARDAYTCQDCGATHCEVHAHHKEPWRKNPALRFEVSNGVTLCGPCHYKRHRGTGNYQHPDNRYSPSSSRQ